MRMVDMQVILPRVGEVSRAQQVHQEENNVQQQLTSVQVNKQTEKIETTVNRAPYADEVVIREKQGREKNRGREEEKEGKEKKGENVLKDEPLSEVKAKDRGSKIDIVV